MISHLPMSQASMQDNDSNKDFFLNRFEGLLNCNASQYIHIEINDHIPYPNLNIFQLISFVQALSFYSTSLTTITSFPQWSMTLTAVLFSLPRKRKGAGAGEK